MPSPDYRSFGTWDWVFEAFWSQVAICALLETCVMYQRVAGYLSRMLVDAESLHNMLTTAQTEFQRMVNP